MDDETQKAIHELANLHQIGEDAELVKEMMADTARLDWLERFFIGDDAYDQIVIDKFPREVYGADIQRLFQGDEVMKRDIRSAIDEAKRRWSR